MNSEHCRHKIFGASWTIDGQVYDTSLFSMIKNTFKLNPDGILSAYHDNAAVLQGPISQRFFWDNNTKIYASEAEQIHTLIKVSELNLINLRLKPITTQQQFLLSLVQRQGLVEKLEMRRL